MSTRATYQINDSVFYIHHDGYPMGAANYLKKMLIAQACAISLSDKMDSQQGPVTLEQAFMYANERAELIVEGVMLPQDVQDAHNAHIDTEFQYVIKERQDGIIVEAYDVGPFEEITGGVEPFFTGKISEFTDQYFNNG